MTEEHVVLLDEQDKPSGTLEKYAAHTLNTPLHLAFSCWLFNEDGQLLVTRRSLSKKHGGRVDEFGLRSSATRRNHRRGDHPPLSVRTRRGNYRSHPVYPHFSYRATDPNGIVENEVCPVFAARATSVLQVNSEEVMDYQWSEFKSVWKSLLATPWAFSPWMVMQASDEQARERLLNYCQR